MKRNHRFTQMATDFLKKRNLAESVISNCDRIKVGDNKLLNDEGETSCAFGTQPNKLVGPPFVNSIGTLVCTEQIQWEL